MPTAHNETPRLEPVPSRVSTITPDNARIAVLLSDEAERASGHLRQAFRRAARNAFLWPDEAADLFHAGRLLTELAGIGPHLAAVVQKWIETPPPAGDPSPLRAEFLTLTQARRILAKVPGWLAHLKGDLQMHTTWSDGSGTVKQMAEAALARGYEFIAITDHTKGLKIANGLDEQRLAAQARDIDDVNAWLVRERASLTVLRSAEVNLSTSGTMDLDPPALAHLDVVLGSFHSALRKTDDQTDRYLAALRNPDLHILGHPQGRVYDYRPGLTADWARVFAEAARLDKAVEIDGYAERQDLKLSLLKIARKEGVRISLGTDAHHPWQLAFIELSLAAAAQAKIPANRIVNFMPVMELREWVASLRSS